EEIGSWNSFSSRLVPKSIQCLSLQERHMKPLFRNSRLSIVLMIGSLAASPASAWAAVTAARELPDGAQFTVAGGTLRIQFWSQDTVRVIYAAASELPALKSLSVVAGPAAVRLARRQDAQTYTLATPRVTVKIDKRNGAVGFFDPAGKVLLREAADGRAIAPATQAGVSGN